jgi:hypothetical protein
MTRTRKLIIAFWIFIGCMLLWQFYDYDKGLDRQALEHPTKTHFVYLPPTDKSAAPVAAHAEGADVQQVGYTVDENDPGNGSFTVHVTLKNVGNAKATGVQIHIRPYRGLRLGDEDAGVAKLRIIDDDDPLAQYGDWLSFPDLAPGESSTQKDVFLSKGPHPVVPGISDMGVPGQPAKKLVPEIIFKSEKAHHASRPPQGIGG